MGLQTALVHLLISPERTLRVLLMKIILTLQLIFSFLVPNKNVRKPDSGIPQPAYYNSWTDVKAGAAIQTLFWVNDLSKHLQNDNEFNRAYKDYQYDEIVKSYFPTKTTTLQAVNISRTWENSYWNSANEGKENAYKKSDILFADMMVNAQGIYKVKKIKHDSVMKNKAINFFEKVLQKNRDRFKEAEVRKSVIDSLIDKDNLFYLDYPALRQMEQNPKFTQEKGQKYSRTMKTSRNTLVSAYIQIPFAIFAKVQGYVKEKQFEKKDSFVCLAAVFNDTFYKDENDEVEENQIFHCFIEKQVQRDRWEMVKIHMAATDTNDFTFRVHLGFLHYASSIYTTAFSNLSKSNRSLKWIQTEFLDIFSTGLLQVNFLANLTLVDHKDPIAEKIFYSPAQKSLHMIKQENSKFNIMEFDPEHLAKDSYESDAVIMSKAYYKKLKIYIDYLFEKYEHTWAGKTREIAEFLLRECRDERGKFDGLPNSIDQDETPESLKKIMTNLAFIWVVRHGETFSLVSVACGFYFVPPMVRKRLSELPENEMNDEEKQEWLPHPEIIKDSMTLHKVVTFRERGTSIVSSWSDLKINERIWQKVLKKEEERKVECYQDFWNDVTLNHEELNLKRTKEGLYNLHWLTTYELPISLNI